MAFETACASSCYKLFFGVYCTHNPLQYLRLKIGTVLYDTEDWPFMNIGYARISTSHQDMERQLQELTAFPCERVYQDTISGALNGQQLTVMLDHLRKDDVVVVSELSRLGRNMRHLLEVVEKVNNAGAAIHSIKEGPVNTNTAMGRTFFYLLGMFAEMEREYNRERTMHGLAVARARGRLGGAREYRKPI